MVAETKTESPDKTQASEAKAAASEADAQELAKPEAQEPEEKKGTEEGDADLRATFLERLGPDGREALKQELLGEQKEEDFEDRVRLETKRRADQERARDFERQDHERRYTLAKTRVRDAAQAGQEITDSMIQELVQTGSDAEFFGPARDAYEAGVKGAPRFRDLSESLQAAILEPKRDLDGTIANMFREYGEAVLKLADAEAKANMEPSIKGRLKLAFEQGRMEAIKEMRPDAPLRLGQGTAVAGEKKYKDLTFEEQGQLAVADRDARTAEFVRSQTAKERQ